jgi:hypothetical protein
MASGSHKGSDPKGHGAPESSGNTHDFARYIRSFRAAFERYICQQQAQQKQDRVQTEQSLNINRHTLWWLRIYSTATIIILVVMTFQAYASWQSVVGVQRAFVSLRSIEVSADPGTTTLPNGNIVHYWLVQPYWENTGNTPTRNLRTYMSPFIPTQLSHTPLRGTVTRITETDPDISFDVPHDGSVWRNTFLAPRHLEGFQGIHTEAQVLQDIFGKQDTTYRIWGVALYDDIFPFTSQHMTRFCYKITAVRGNPMDVASKIELAYEQCLRGNCTDDDCTEK